MDNEKAVEEFWYQRLPVVVGVHTGTAFVGMVRGVEGTPMDFTALGDNVNPYPTPPRSG
jgi:class 3 adenylate cyclase